ncbi:MAG: DUF4166 domain-containing protein [Bacteroidia bacterium]
MGTNFERLHIMMQARYGLHHEEGISCIGEGIMERMESGNIWVKPFLWLGIRRKLLFPERGRNIPFVLENHPFQSPDGTSCISFNAFFYFPETIRQTKADMRWDEKQNGISYALGKKKKLVTSLHLEVDSRGHLLMRSGRLFRLFGESLRLPAWPGGFAEVEEWYDEREDRFHIRVSIAHPFFGKIYHYEGWFRCRFVFR